MFLKKTISLFSIVFTFTALSSCSNGTWVEGGIFIKGDEVTITDSLNQKTTFNKIPTNAVFLQSSLAVPWLLCEGKVKGICGDYKEYKLDTEFNINEQNTSIIGNSAHSPDKAKIIECNPDIVFYSPDISAQKEVAVGLLEAGFKVCAFKIDNFNEYCKTLAKYSAILTRKESSEYIGKYCDEVKTKIEEYKNKAKNKSANAIAFRARSTGYTIFRDIEDHFILEIFNDLNIENKANLTWDSKAFDFSKLLSSDPQYIFYFHMGVNNASTVEKYLNENVRSNPIWNELDAVKNQKVKCLPQDIFHYKPNHRWAEAYKEIYNIVYGE